MGGAGSPNLPTPPLSSLRPPSTATDTGAGLSHRSRTPRIPPCALPTPAVFFPSPARANPRVGVSRASRFLVLRKEELGVGVGQRQAAGGRQGGQSSAKSRGTSAGKSGCTTEQQAGGKTLTHGLEKKLRCDAPRTKRQETNRRIKKK